MNKQNRYPGIRPFSADDNRLFFGRSESIKRINRLFKLEKLIVLFGKSGLGKTSLVQAGAIPILQKEDLADGVEDFRFELLRFGAYHNGDSSQKGLTSETPVERIRRAIIGDHQMDNADLFKIVEDDHSPWMAAKALQMDGDARTIVLILDQSEELFTWPQEEVDHVKDALQSLLNQNIPDAIRRTLHRAAREGELDYNLLMAPPAAKAMLVIRSDKLDSLDQLADVLPDIYNKRYELPPLDRMAATEAILEPAQLSGEFSTPVFAYSDDCLNYILDFLSNTSEEKNETKGGKYQERIEGFQLQLICQHAEFTVKEKIVAGETNVVLQKEDIGDLQEVTRSYYQRVLNGIQDDDEREQVQVLVEEGLIYEAGPDSRRLSLFDGLIESQYKVGPDKLEYLGNSRLLRRVSLPEGGFSYEISHDSLLAPILAVKEVRKGVEQQAEEAEAARLALIEQQERDAEAAKERQRKRTAMYLAVVSVLTILALGGMGFAFWQSNRASQQEEIALSEAQKAKDARIQAETEKAIADSLRARSEATSEELKEQTIALNKLAQDLQAANRLAKLETFRANQEREKSANINQKLFSSALGQKYSWLNTLVGLNLPAFEAPLYPEWVENGNKMGDSLRLSETSMSRLDGAAEIVRISQSNPDVALRLTHDLLQTDESDLTIALANTLLRRGVYTVSQMEQFPEVFDGEFIEYVEDPKSEIEYALGSRNGEIILLDSNLERVEHETIEGHDQSVTCIAFSEDGRFMGTGSTDFHVKVYDRDKGYQLISNILYGEDWVRDITFSQDGLTMFVVGDVFKMKVYELSENPNAQRDLNNSEDQSAQVFSYQAEYGGYESYILSIDVSEDGSQIVTGGEYGELFLWQKQGIEWILQGNTMLGESINDIHFVGNNIRGILANGDMMEIHPMMENGSMVLNPRYISLVDPDSYYDYQAQWGIGKDKGDEIFFSPGNGQLGILTVEDSSKNFIWTSDQAITRMALNDRKSRLLVVNEYGEVKLFSVGQQKGNLSAADLKSGKGLPDLDPLIAMRYGLFDASEIDKMSKADQYSLLEGLGNQNVPVRYRASFDATRDKLLVSYISTSEIRGSGDLTESEELEKRVNVLKRILTVTEREGNARTSIKSLNIFKETLIDGQLSPLSEWLILASKVGASEELEVKRWLASKAYQLFPDPAWKSMMEDSRGKYFLGKGNTSPLDTYVMGRDVNSVVFSGSGTNMFVTTDVDSPSESMGGYYFDISEDGLRLDLLWSIPEGAYPDGTIVWDGDISPSGKRAMTLGANGETRIWDLEARELLASIDLMKSCRVGKFMDDSRVLIGSENGVMLLTLSRNGGVDTSMVYQTGDYHGETSALLVLPNEVWVAGFGSGSIITNTLEGNDEIEIQLEELNGVFLDMAYDTQHKTVLVSQANIVYSLEVDEEYLLKESTLSNFSVVNGLADLYAVDNIEQESLVVWAGMGGDIGVATAEDQYILFRNESGEQFFDIAVSADGRSMVAANANDILYLFSREQLGEMMIDWVKESSNSSLDPERSQGIRDELTIQLGEEWADEVWQHIISQ